MGRKKSGEADIVPQAEDAASQIRARELAAIYANVRDVIFHLAVEPDDRFRFVMVNPAFLEVTGLTEDQVVGRLFQEVIPEPAHALVLGNYKEAVRTGKSVGWEEVSGYPAGKKYGEVSVAPIHDADGTCTHLVGVVHDITKHRQAEEEIRRQAERLRRTLEGAALAIGRVVEMHDPHLAGHGHRVSELATAIAEDMGLRDQELTALRLGCLIHDLGKMSVPTEVLAKPSRLNEIEFGLVKQHPATGFEILEAVGFEQSVADAVRQHHERLDGSGYPDGLKGNDILLEARILAVADVVEAMASHRPYRPALGMEAALAEIREHAGKLYDPEAVAACERVIAAGFEFEG